MTSPTLRLLAELRAHRDVLADAREHGRPATLIASLEAEEAVIVEQLFDGGEIRHRCCVARRSAPASNLHTPWLTADDRIDLRMQMRDADVPRWIHPPPRERADARRAFAGLANAMRNLGSAMGGAATLAERTAARELALARQELERLPAPGLRQAGLEQLRQALEMPIDETP